MTIVPIDPLLKLLHHFGVDSELVRTLARDAMVWLLGYVSTGIRASVSNWWQVRRSRVKLASERARTFRVRRKASRNRRPL